MFAEKFKLNEHSTWIPSLPIQETRSVTHGVDTRISSVSSQFISKRHSPRMNACSSNNFYHQTIVERDGAIAFISTRHCQLCLNSVEYAVRRPHLGTLQNRVRQYWHNDLRKTKSKSKMETHRSRCWIRRLLFDIWGCYFKPKEQRKKKSFLFNRVWRCLCVSRLLLIYRMLLCIAGLWVSRQRKVKTPLSRIFFAVVFCASLVRIVWLMVDRRFFVRLANILTNGQ